MLGYNIVMWWNKQGHRRTKCRLRDGLCRWHVHDWLSGLKQRAHSFIHSFHSLVSAAQYPTISSDVRVPYARRRSRLVTARLQGRF